MSSAASRIDVLAPVEQEGTKASVKTWLKGVGDHIDEGEPLLELETDKVAMEVSAPATGTLVEVLITDGQSAEKGAILGRIDEQAAAPSVDAEGAGAPEAAAAAPHATATSAASAPAAPARAFGSFDPALKLSPSVRRLLIETGLDPTTIPGTGKGGRLTSADVEGAARAPRPAVTPAPPAHDAPAPPVGVAPAVAGSLASTRIPHDTMRRRIAEHMVRSLTTAPHVTALFEADFGAIMAHREANKAALQQRGIHLTLTAYIVLAAVEAMKAVPVVNSRWHDDFVELFDDVNIGVGTALGDKGLIVPVVHRAQTLSLIGVAQRLQEATQRARAGTLTPADVQHGTFTVSNHGVSGSLTASPIVINQPQAAILGVGKVEKRVVVREVNGTDAMLIRPMSYVTLSIDHRVIDGAQTNAWLTRFVEVIEGWPTDDRPSR